MRAYVQCAYNCVHVTRCDHINHPGGSLGRCADEGVTNRRTGWRYIYIKRWGFIAVKLSFFCNYLIFLFEDEHTCFVAIVLTHTMHIYCKYDSLNGITGITRLIIAAKFSENILFRLFCCGSSKIRYGENTGKTCLDNEWCLQLN